MPVPPVVLSIAGYDPSSGAGITADVKTAAAHGCFAATCITALTVQSTQGVFQVQPVDPELVARTLAALSDDLEIASVRLGMLGSGAVAEVVADFLESSKLLNVVVDPVVRSSSGTLLQEERGLEILRSRLLSLCDVVTPNVDEAAMLVGVEPVPAETSWDAALPRIREMAAGLHQLGSRAIVVTGGHLREANDYLGDWSSGKLQEEIICGERLESQSTHGTGCAFATALACRLASGASLSAAVGGAKQYVRKAILTSHPLGKGTGPVNHLG